MFAPYCSVRCKLLTPYQCLACKNTWFSHCTLLLGCKLVCKLFWIGSCHLLMTHFCFDQLDWTFGPYIDLFTVCLTFFELPLAIFSLFGFEGLVSCFECLSITNHVVSLELFRERSDFFWIVRFKRELLVWVYLF